MFILEHNYIKFASETEFHDIVVSAFEYTAISCQFE